MILLKQLTELHNPQIVSSCSDSEEQAQYLSRILHTNKSVWKELIPLDVA